MGASVVLLYMLLYCIYSYLCLLTFSHVQSLVVLYITTSSVQVNGECGRAKALSCLQLSFVAWTTKMLFLTYFPSYQTVFSQSIHEKGKVSNHRLRRMDCSSCWEYTIGSVGESHQSIWSNAFASSLVKQMMDLAVSDTSQAPDSLSP